MCCGSCPTRRPAHCSSVSFAPPSPIPVSPASVSTVTTRSLWLKMGFGFGGAYTRTRVIFDLGMAACATRADGSAASPIPDPAARKRRRFITTVYAELSFDVMRQLSVPLLLLTFVFQARPANNFALTVDSIMRGPELVGYEPAAVRWSHDGQSLYFQWKKYSDQIIAPIDTYAVNRDGSNLRKLTDEEIKSLPPAFGDTTRDQRLTVYTNSGDLYIYDNTTGKTQQLTKTTDNEANPRFTQDGKRVSFTRNGNLYVMPLDSGMLVQVTDIRAAASAGAAVPAADGRGGGGGRGGG